MCFYLPDFQEDNFEIVEHIFMKVNGMRVLWNNCCVSENKHRVGSKADVKCKISCYGFFSFFHLRENISLQH